MQKCQASLSRCPLPKALSPKPEYLFDNSVLKQTRLCVLRWNPGPRRGKPGAIEEDIAGKWHVMALQEGIEYLQHECLTNHFCTTHFAGCAIFFNKDTCHSDIKVKYLHDTRNGQHHAVKEGHCRESSPAVPRSEGFRTTTSPTYHDVASHQQPFCKEAWHWKELVAYNPYCNATRASRHGGG